MINIIKTLRMHHWVTNVLIFLPFVASHQVISMAILHKLLLYFLSFSLCASAGYIINDLFDIKKDKKHFFKKNRPLASGKLSKQTASIIAIALLILSFFIAKNFGENNFLLILAIYFVLSFFYSAFLKKLILIDVIGLATLYTLRIFAGSQIGNIEISFWLIVFSIFFFLSLAFFKRYNEISKIKINTY
jgi:4-hydroxybenzoate polyprenyltransferase